jgi:hypothetical protein
MKFENGRSLVSVVYPGIRSAMVLESPCWNDPGLQDLTGLRFARSGVMRSGDGQVLGLDC